MNAASKNLFVSYNRHDRAFAEWIAWILEDAGHSVTIEAWDFRAGGNFVQYMDRAVTEADITIAVLSETYLNAAYTQPEWGAAFAQDPTGDKRKLIPVRVKECNVSGLLSQIVYIDLVGLEEKAAQERLLCEIFQTRLKPDRKPTFPGNQELTASRSKPVFPPSIPANLPRISDVFVGREVDLEELHEKLQTGRATAISAIAGMGGIGKTELAAQYAVQHRDLGTYPGGICWLKGREELGTQIVGFGRSRLRLSIPDDVDLSEQVRLCWEQWQAEESLIVFDDVQEYGNIESFLPPQQSYFKVLLTTRSRFGSPVQNHEIQVLSEVASLNLLRAVVSDGRIDQDLEIAKQVCEWLGYLPLGLELVGRYLARRKGTSIAKLWGRLQAQKLAAKALLEAEPSMTASLGVTAAFELSWQELDLKAQQLAALLSLFALAEIPWSLVQACLPEVDEEELEDLREEQLVNLSLLNCDREDVFSLHQLLREFFAVKRSQMPEDEEWKRSFCRVMSAIALQMPITWTLSSIEQFSATLPHLEEATTALEPWLADSDVHKPATRIGRFYQEQSSFGAAEKWLLYGRSISTQRLGERHPDVATSLNNLAELYRSQGRYEEAEPLHIQALDLSRSLLGENHPDVATSLNNLALLYKLQGRYEDAEPLYIQSLELMRSLLGENHPNSVASLNNLALLYQSQGRYEEAELLLIQAMESSHSLFGKTHPDVAQGLNNLALLYHAQGRYEEAEPLLIQALESRRLLFGKTHPDVAQGLNNLALLYHAQGRYEEAEPLYIQALELWRSLLGETYPGVAQGLNNLAALYSSQERYEEAERLYISALQISRQVLGKEHSDVAIQQNNLAALYLALERYIEAELSYLEAITIFYQQLGETHPNTQTAQRNFVYFIQKVIQSDRTSELSDHPMTRSLLEQLQNEES